MPCHVFLPAVNTRSSGGAHGAAIKPPGVSGAQNLGLHQHQLDRLIWSFFMKCLAESTHKAYSCWQKRFLNFCAQHSLAAVPAGEDVPCKFVAHLTTESLKHCTIESYMAGICHLRIEEGLGDPFLSTLAKL